MSAKNHSSQFLNLVNSIKSEVKEITAAELSAQLKSTEKFYLIDVREESEWREGHLPAAMHLSKGVIERDIEKCVPDSKAHIILYCSGGFRSALAAVNIQRMGYQHVASLSGGSRSWLEAGLPMVKE